MSEQEDRGQGPGEPEESVLVRAARPGGLEYFSYSGGRGFRVNPDGLLVVLSESGSTIAIHRDWMNVEFR